MAALATITNTDDHENNNNNKTKNEIVNSDSSGQNADSLQDLALGGLAVSALRLGLQGCCAGFWEAACSQSWRKFLLFGSKQN